MAKRKRRKGGKRKMVCPKTRSGKKVIASKGRCYVRTYVKKVKAGGKARRRKAGRRRRAKR